MERWERRERKLRKRREGMQVSGIGLKKVVLPTIRRKAERAEKSRDERPRRTKRRAREGDPERS